MCAGEVLYGHDQQQYAQPRILYTLQTVVQSQDNATTTAQQEIIVVPRSEPAPPVHTGYAAGDFITTADSTMRFALFHRQYQMTVEMPEPHPVSLKRLQDFGKGELELRVSIRSLGTDPDKNAALERLPASLKDLKFTLRVGLRTETFYSCKPFIRAPSQDMVDPEGALHLQESVSKLPELCLAARSWEPHFTNSMPESSVLDAATTRASDASFCNGSTKDTLQAWVTRLAYPLRLDHALLPTFCSAIASRQYSVVGRVIVKGVRVQDFILECPLQVNYLLDAAAHTPSPGEQNGAAYLDTLPALSPVRQNEAFEFMGWKAGMELFRSLCGPLKGGPNLTRTPKSG
ncbi:hypothetical protein LTS10_013273 [Elasticomyces elasticus]|nr:hypothetical protein LTS10_013273 [Elasticomyces elasticus]